MSFSHMKILPSEEPEYLNAFFTEKKGNSMSRLSTCRPVNLQFFPFSIPICPERIFICSITPIILSMARLLSLFEKKLLRSDIIVVSLFTASKFALYSLENIKLLIFNELCKLRSLSYSKFMLIYTSDSSLAKLE